MKIVLIALKQYIFLMIEATDVDFLKKELSYSFLAWAENFKKVKMIILGRKLTKLEKLSNQLNSNICNVHICLF